MAKPRRHPRIQKRLQRLVAFARGEGWEVVQTAGGHLKFCKAGCASVYASSTTGDRRAEHNARAQLRRAAHPARPKDADPGERHG